MFCFSQTIFRTFKINLKPILPSTSIQKHNMSTSNSSTKILHISKQLNTALQSLELEKHIPLVSHIYHPLDYALDPYSNYLTKYCDIPKVALFVGMNPSPHGMCQTGIPFGDVHYVKNWLKIEGHVKIPKIQHPKYPIRGFSYEGTEVSGRRLWGFLSRKFGKAEEFFKGGFVVNYCPITMVGTNGFNLTPESPEVQTHPLREKMEGLCDDAMLEIIEEIKPKHIVGIGWYATRLCQNIVKKSKSEVKVHYLRHPSPRAVQNVEEWERTFSVLLKQIGRTDD